MAKAALNDSSEFYTGDDGVGDCRFPVDQWIEWQRRLATADVVMRMVALEFGLEFRGNLTGRIPWPARRLIAHARTKVIEVRIALNSRYLEDKDPSFELAEQTTPRFLFRWFSPGDFSVLKRYSAAQINDRALVRTDIEEALSQHGLTPRSAQRCADPTSGS